MYSLMSALPRYRAHTASASTSPSAQQRSLSPTPTPTPTLTPTSSADASPDQSTPASPSFAHSAVLSSAASPSASASVLLSFCAASAERDPPVVLHDHLQFTVGGQPLLFRSLHRGDLLELRRLQEQLFPVRYSDDFYCSLLQPHIVSLLAFLPQPPPLLPPDDTAADAGAPSSTESPPQPLSVLVCLALVSYPPPPAPRPCSSKSANTAPAYLITLGVSRPFRQLGLGSLLLSCLPTLPGLHAVREWRLHVLEGNEAAVRLYVRGGWVVRERLLGHYHIDGKLHNALEMGREEDGADSAAAAQDGCDGDEGDTDDEDGKGTVSKRRRIQWVCVRRNWTPGSCAIQ